MEKKFFKVFEGLEMPKKMHDLFEDVDVERIVASKAKKMVYVHIFSRHLINKSRTKGVDEVYDQ